jgi:hypothetical protein
LASCSTECSSGFVCNDDSCQPDTDTPPNDGGVNPVDSSLGEQETVSIEACAELGGEPLGLIGFFPNSLGDPNVDLTRNDPCPGSRTLLGTISGIPGDPNGGLCCAVPPAVTIAQCLSSGGTTLGDPGGGSTYRDGCNGGQRLLGWLTLDCPDGAVCGEGGICCASTDPPASGDGGSLLTCTGDPSSQAEWACDADTSTCEAVPLPSEGCPVPWGCGTLDATLDTAVLACTDLGLRGGVRRGEGCGYIIIEWWSGAPTGAARAFYDAGSGALVGTWRFTSDVDDGEPHCSGSVPLDCYSWETSELLNPQILCAGDAGLQ